MELAWLHFRAIDPATDRLLSAAAVRRFAPAAYARWARTLAALQDGAPTAVVRHALREVAHGVVAEVLAQAPEPRPLPPLVTRALAEMEASALRRPSLAGIARRVGCSSGHLQRAFAAAVGTSPARWLEDLRMREARRLLEAGLPVQEAAVACGYPDPYHFSRVVARFWGRPPRAFRNRRLP